MRSPVTQERVASMRMQVYDIYDVSAGDADSDDGLTCGRTPVCEQHMRITITINPPAMPSTAGTSRWWPLPLFCDCLSRESSKAEDEALGTGLRTAVVACEVDRHETVHAQHPSICVPWPSDTTECTASMDMKRHAAGAVPKLSVMGAQGMASSTHSGSTKVATCTARPSEMPRARTALF